MPKRGDDHRLVVVGARRRHHARHQPHRRLVQQPGQLPRLVPFDDAADRRGSLSADPGRGERAAVDGIDVSAGARQDDRAVRRRAIEIEARRRPAFDHRRLVVAAAEQPRAFRQARREGANPRGQILHPRDAAEVEHRGQQVTDLPDVRVGIIQPGDESPPREIDAPRQRAGGGHHVLGAADHLDPAVADADGGGQRRRGLGEDAAVVQDEIEHRVSRGGQTEAAANRDDTVSMARPIAPRPSRSMSSGMVNGGSRRSPLL